MLAGTWFLLWVLRWHPRTSMYGREGSMTVKVWGRGHGGQSLIQYTDVI